MKNLPKGLDNVFEICYITTKVFIPYLLLVLLCSTYIIYLFYFHSFYLFTFFMSGVLSVTWLSVLKVLSMTLQVDSDGNLIYSQTGFEYLSGINGILQDLTYRLRLLNNEYKLGDEGINYPDLINRNNSQIINNTLIEELNKDPRVSYATIKQLPSEPHVLTLDIFVKSE